MKVGQKLFDPLKGLLRCGFGAFIQVLFTRLSTDNVGNSCTPDQTGFGAGQVDMHSMIAAVLPGLGSSPVCHG
jgi:hypothetical protein